MAEGRPRRSRQEIEDERAREERRRRRLARQRREARRRRQIIAGIALAVLFLLFLLAGFLIGRFQAGRKRTAALATPASAVSAGAAATELSADTHWGASSGGTGAVETVSLPGKSYPSLHTGAQAVSSMDSTLPSSAESSISPIPENEPTPTPEPVAVSFTISAAGDCTLGTDEGFEWDTSLPAMYEAVGYPDYFFENVYDIFASDDLTIVNLEGTLTHATDREDKTFAFKGDPSYTSILTAGSVEAVDFANNHDHDYGEQSYTDTIEAVSNAGIALFGHERTCVLDVKGVKVGLIGIYELPYGADCEDIMISRIEEVRQEGAQVVIVSFHWGIEGDNYPDDNQFILGRSAIDHGADLVLGHHPHVLQGIEVYKGRNIVYSLGNFCFGGNSNPRDKDTMIFQQTFTVTDGVKVEDNVRNIIPCRLSSHSDYNDYRPTPLYGDEGERVTARIDEFSSWL